MLLTSFEATVELSEKRKTGNAGNVEDDDEFFVKDSVISVMVIKLP